MNIKRITTEADLHAALNIRKTVFIEEQHVSESEEFDEFDTLQEQCQHVLVYHENQPVGTGRVRIVDHTAKLERICILKPYRKYGLGKVIVSGLEEIIKEKGLTACKLAWSNTSDRLLSKTGLPDFFTGIYGRRHPSRPSDKRNIVDLT
nr:GNAT family N-acetyltransferase [Bacillus subtilis]